MTTQITLVLDSCEVGQILDGLSLRAEAWERTGRYLRGEVSPDDFVEECAAPEEADKIMNYYRSIIAKIKAQRARG